MGPKAGHGVEVQQPRSQDPALEEFSVRVGGRVETQENKPWYSVSVRELKLWAELREAKRQHLKEDRPSMCHGRVMFESSFRKCPESRHGD